jgi:hypothetical protein
MRGPRPEAAGHYASFVPSQRGATVGGVATIGRGGFLRGGSPPRLGASGL